MKLNINVVDAFTTQQFSGNQAAVVLLESWLSSELMQSIASENNLSETAFVVSSSSGVFEIRWFSPIKEIDFCGHATLASAFVIFDVVVTARSEEFDFASRYFWPANGGIEDPVTGSIHAGLAPYWAKILNKQKLVALQASSRSGVLY